MAGTATAQTQGLYGAGQDLLKEAFSGNVRGMGPAVAELEFEERPNEPFLFFAADKTDPGAYNPIVNPRLMVQRSNETCSTNVSAGLLPWFSSSQVSTPSDVRV